MFYRSFEGSCHYIDRFSLSEFITIVYGLLRNVISTIISTKILQERFHVWQSRNAPIGLSDRIFRLRKHARRCRSYVNFRTNWRSLPDTKEEVKSEERESCAISLVQFFPNLQSWWIYFALICCRFTFLINIWRETKSATQHQHKLCHLFILILTALQGSPQGVSFPKRIVPSITI